MHVEIQVALNFLISFLYNKLPRRRVNQFGEELEKALKIKFDGHWYPEKPFKGSAFRCLKTAPPLDPVFELAARESGMDLSDIQENLPQEMSIWVDPGEVSYRMGEKVPVKILYSESDTSSDDGDREISRTFNPEAQCFKPIDSVANQLANLSMSPTAGLSAATSATSAYGVTGSTSPTYKTSTSPVNAFIPKSTAPLTFTTATFAQTKFGSTKLKTSSKRSHRMSPTEFSNYIKQRAMLQQQQSLFGQRPRSPNAQQVDPNLLLVNQFAAAAPFAGNRSFGIFENGYLGDLFSTGPGKNAQRPPSMNPVTPGGSRFSPFLEKTLASNNLGLATADSASANGKTTFSFDGVNFNLNSVAYPNQYQHLLVAN